MKLTWTADYSDDVATTAQGNELRVERHLHGPTGRESFTLKHCGMRLYGSYRTRRGARRAALNIAKEEAALAALGGAR